MILPKGTPLNEKRLRSLKYNLSRLEENPSNTSWFCSGFSCEDCPIKEVLRNKFPDPSCCSGPQVRDSFEEIKKIMIIMIDTITRLENIKDVTDGWKI